MSKYNHISPTLSTLGWLTIKEHLVYRDALLTFKSINNIAPPYLCDKFEERNRIYNRDTRRKGDLDIPKCKNKTSSGQSSFKYRGTKIWNGLNTDLKSTSKVTFLRQNLRQALLKGDDFLFS